MAEPFTLPLPSLYCSDPRLVVVVSMISSSRFFVPSIATSGGPGIPRVIYLYIYEKAFQQFDMGYASACVVLYALVILTLFQLKLARSSGVDMD